MIVQWVENGVLVAHDDGGFDPSGIRWSYDIDDLTGRFLVGLVVLADGAAHRCGGWVLGANAHSEANVKRRVTLALRMKAAMVLRARLKVAN
jgi:hypothetical protein